MIINNKNLIIVVTFAIILLAVSGNAYANVKNTVSATANTGGNTVSGGGTIKTGDATASVKSENSVSGGTDVQNKIDAKAEAQGNRAMASVSVNGDKKTCTADSGENCQVEINKTTDNNSITPDSANAAAGAGSTDKADKTEPENIVQKTFVAIEQFTKNITDKIISWFS